MRHAKDFRAASRHSLMVKVAKIALPAAALVVTVGFIAQIAMSYNPVSGVSLSNIGLEDGKLVMAQPKMAGFDKNNRPYGVTASRALQDINNPSIIELESIDAQIPMDTKNSANVGAKSGTYDTTKELLVLRDGVTIKGARGMNIQLQDANIDIKSGSMISDKPVLVTSPNTSISADTVQVKDSGKHIIFKNRVKMTIIQPVSRGIKPSANDG